MPYRIRPGVELPKKVPQATLSWVDGKFLIHQVIDVATPSAYEPIGFLGGDLGIVNILVDSEGVRYTSGCLNGLRKRHAQFRAKLQSKGTRSAKRLLLKRRRKEGRFARDANHIIAKRVVSKAKMLTFGIALEDLKGIRERVRVRKAARRQHTSWAFNQLRGFIEYKAILAGVPTVLVDPRNTSRTCPQCGCVEKRNRLSQAKFLCVSCGMTGHADTIAAQNIAQRAVQGRAGGDQPDALPKGNEQVLVSRG